MSRKWWAVVGVVVAAGLVSSTSWFLADRPGITHANFRRIREGDTAAQVEEVFGVPSCAPPDYHRDRLPRGHRREVWEGEAGAAIVTFDAAGQVVTAVWDDYSLSLLDRVRRALHLR